jgi:hypothetical protein
MMFNVGFTETAALRWHVALAHQPSGAEVPGPVIGPTGSSG